MSIPVFKPSIKRRDMHSVLSCLVTDVIGPAAIAGQLVDAVAGLMDCAGGFALREHIRAIELVLSALDLKTGDKVLISALAPSAYLRAMTSFGVIPVFVDVKEEDACIDPHSAADLLDSDIKAIFVDAPLGRIPDMHVLSEYGLPVIVDLGEALGAIDHEEPLGRNAHFIILPMEADAIATCGGGTVVLAKSRKDYGGLGTASQSTGINSFMPDLNASLGLVQWREYPQALETRYMIEEIYQQSLLKSRHRTLAGPKDETSRAVPYSFPVVISGNIGEVQRYARKKGVETLMAFSGRFLDESIRSIETCPKAKSLSLGTLLFPLYPTLGKKDVQLIVKILSTMP